MKAVKRFFVSLIIISTLVLVITGIKVFTDNREFASLSYLKNLEFLESLEDSATDVLSNLSDSQEDSLDTLFSGTQYLYYSLLDSNEKEVYIQAYRASVNLDLSFSPQYVVYEDDIKDVMAALFYDHPELFYLNTSYSYETYSNGRCGKVNLEYNECAYNLSERQALFDDEVNKILAGAMMYSTAYDQEKYVHDYIISTTDYNIDATLNQSAYSALVNHSTVCTGYAKAFQVVMNRLGIPTYICVGDSDGMHAWNIVLLDDGYYNVDLTWDDQWTVIYNFFNCTDDDLSSSHVRTGLSVGLPACNATAYRGLEGIYNDIIYIPGTEESIPVPQHDDRPVIAFPDESSNDNHNPDMQPPDIPFPNF